MRRRRGVHERSSSSPRVAKIDPLDEAHYRRLLNENFSSTKQACAGIVHLWSLDIDASEPSPGPSLCGKGNSEDAAALGCGGALQLVRALSRTSLSKQPPLWLVTAGAQAVDVAGDEHAAPIAVEQSPMIGFGRVAALELPDFRPRLVDLDVTQCRSATGRSGRGAGGRNSESKRRRRGRLSRRQALCGPACAAHRAIRGHRNRKRRNWRFRAGPSNFASPKPARSTR